MIRHIKMFFKRYFGGVVQVMDSYKKLGVDTIQMQIQPDGKFTVHTTGFYGKGKNLIWQESGVLLQGDEGRPVPDRSTYVNHVNGSIDLHAAGKLTTDECTACYMSRKLGHEMLKILPEIAMADD